MRSSLLDYVAYSAIFAVSGFEHNCKRRKLKMFAQIVSVVAAILDHKWMVWHIGQSFIFPVDLIARVAIWFMVAVSIVSAVDYFVAFWSKIDREVSASRRRRKPFVLTRRRGGDLPSHEAQPNS